MAGRTEMNGIQIGTTSWIPIGEMNQSLFSGEVT